MISSPPLVLKPCLRLEIKQLLIIIPFLITRDLVGHPLKETMSESFYGKLLPPLGAVNTKRPPTWDAASDPEASHPKFSKGAFSPSNTWTITNPSAFTG